MSPAFAFTLGIFAAVAFAVPVALHLWRRAQRAETQTSAAAFEAEKGREIMSAAPDGLFSWDLADGSERCSRRLAVLLALDEGTGAAFTDVLSRFDDDAASALDREVRKLRTDGTGFNLLLPLGQRLLHVIGVRAGTADDIPVADLIWMRDIHSSIDASAPLFATAERDRFWALLDSLPFPVWLRDSELELAFTNIAAQNTAGSEPVRELARRARDEDRSLSERYLLTLDGSPRLLDVTESPLKEWAGTVGFAIDRSAAEQLEGEYARHEAAHDQVLENLSTAMAIFGSDTRLRFFNTAYARLWELEDGWLSSEPALGEVLQRLRELRRIPEFADFNLFRDEQLALFDTLKEPTEGLMHLPDGTTLRSVISPHALGGLVFSYEDVTDRLALERSYNTLIAVQGETLDNLHEGVAVFGSDGRLKLANPSFAKLWGFEPDDLSEELHVTSFVEKTRPLIAGEGDWMTHKEQVISRMTNREPSSGQLMRTDGLVLDYANVPLPDGAVLLSYMDVTDSVQVGLALRERAEALLEADRLKSDFISDVSYEIRSPLTTIIGFAQVMSEETFGKLNPRQTEYVRGILEASQGLTAVISDIFDLATVEAGMMTLELDTVDLHGMMASVLGLMRERAKRKNMKLMLECPTDIGWIVGDEKRLKQVLFNLLSNAVSFSPQRTSIRLQGERKADEVILRVSDTGSGLSQSEQQLVFNAFETTAAADPAKAGPGLGLTLVRRFVELHGGYVRIKSSPGRGTSVSCHLPASAQEKESAERGVGA